MYEDFRCCFYSALSQWTAVGGCYIASMPGFFPGVSLPTQLIMKQNVKSLKSKQFARQKLQSFNKAMKPKASFGHYITMVPLADSMPEFFPVVPLPT